MTWENDARKIVTMAFGLALAGLGGFFLWLEMRSPPAHSTHIYVFSGFIAVGCLIVAPSTFFGALQKAVGLIPSVTISGGRRANDPPTRPPDSGEN
jgi:ABC-type uncharacterized transport system permease subunit